MKFLPVLLAVSVAALGAALLPQQPPPVSDQVPEPRREQTPTDDEVNAVAKKLYCPVCPNTPLDVCETQACRDWREQIRDQLAAGWSEDEVMDYFASQYGERVLAEPGRSGFTSFLWVLPALVVVLGLATLTVTLRKWRARSVGRCRSSATDGPHPIDVEVPPEVRNRIEEDVRNLT